MMAKVSLSLPIAMYLLFQQTAALHANSQKVISITMDHWPGLLIANVSSFLLIVPITGNLSAMKQIYMQLALPQKS